MEETNTLLQDTGANPTTAIVDLGHQRVDKTLGQVEVIHRGKFESLTPQHESWLTRRQAIEPLIGHTRTLITAWIGAG